MDYQSSKLSPMRRFQIDGFDALPNPHPISALMELDVSVPLDRIEALRARGVRVSLFAHLVSAVGRALAEFPDLNSAQIGRRLVRYADVDVSVPVERRTENGRYPLMLVIRKAQEKTAREIFGEIEDAKSAHSRTGTLSEEDAWVKRGMRVLGLLPRFARVAFFRAMLRSARSVQRAGTTQVTSVGKFASIPGFVSTFTTGPRATGFVVGGVTDKAVARDGHVVIRPVLAFTAVFNHDLVDGSPAARFAERLRDLIESGEGLPAVARAEAAA